MRKVLVVMATVGVGVALSPAAGLAAGNNHNGPTVGDCISDGFYGNEPNIVDPFAPGGPSEQTPGSKGGRVEPSQSPGPKVTNPDGSVRNGSSVGDVNQQFGGGALPAFCRAATS